MKVGKAERLASLPEYLFAEIDRRRREALAAGRDLIDLGIGDPDRPTPRFIVERMMSAVQEPRTHRYPPGRGLRELRQAITEWFEVRFGVKLDAERETLVLIGSKEGIGHLPLAVVNPGDVVLVPDPGYPVYWAAALFAGGRVHPVRLEAERGWLPDLEAIPADVWRSARLMYLNYPNNPTSAVASLEFFERVVALARKYEVLIAQDAAYCEVAFDERPPSILQVPGAREVAVEFHSFSKTFNMTGWRIGFAVGHAEALEALAAIKSNLDSGQFGAIQLAAVEALQHYDHLEVKAQLDVYRERRDVLTAGLRELGYTFTPPKATFYVWARCPEGMGSVEFAAQLLEKADVVVVPGAGFGAGGENWFRLALTVSVEEIQEALERLRHTRL